MWRCGNSGGSRHHPVGGKLANPFGLHDMHGNVYEWCEDVLNGSFYSDPASLGPDPLSLTGSDRRVIRGGFGGTFASFCRSAARRGYGPSGRGWFIGFRPVMPLP